ncbi:hypothetical protein J3R30DRAFT_3693971 [Lentinula aciculospora]|uniref:BHLH domain-containing protein n=1 Tax=Lentinula aciculospora TaxID=153920 RepID=A0A9W9AWQ8_9AGAR|nr:hypothetical protein J3R30DRAFT_3693971 [Lentinula aciculospora]
MTNTSTAAVLYNASVNPSRRAKVNRMTERTILPRQTAALDNSESTIASDVAPEINQGHAQPRSPTTARRGRKPASLNPSGLSRSAREAQRKLNHSIIEKARRTKINEALADLARLGATVEILHTGGTLKDAEALVSRSDALADRPPSESVEDEDEDDVDIDNDDDKDGDYEAPSSGRTRSGGALKSKPLDSSKDHNSASKGKEKFKLDILIKTVENMQFLLERVRKLEADLKDVKSFSQPDLKEFDCCKCAERTLVDRLPSTSTFTTNKRKRYPSAEYHAAHDGALEEFPENADQLRDQRRRKVVYHNPGSQLHERHILPSLPPISSWLLDYSPSAPSVSSSRDTLASLVARSSSSSPNLSGPGPLQRLSPFDVPQRQRFPSNAPSPSSMIAYLPSPPSSTQFPASILASSGGVPALELGPSSVSTRAISPSFSIRGRSSSNLSMSTNAPDFSALPSASRDVMTTTTTATGGLVDTAHTYRTPEEENAASLLLHMKSSPPVFMTARSRRDSISERIDSLPSSMSSPISPEMSKSIPKALDGKETENAYGLPAIVVQTPGSILGLGVKLS